MALLDHFRPPLSTRRHWHSFHNAWCTYLAEALNQALPEGYFAEPNAQFGIEIDVAMLNEPLLPSLAAQDRVFQRTPDTIWQPKSPTATLPFQPTTDVVEVQIFSAQAGPLLVGAIELVSPANKDRPAHRTAFVSKCQTYLQQGVGLMMVDCVTTLAANLHNELMQRLELAISPLEANLYATAYHVTAANQAPSLAIWQEPLQLDNPLPTLPLYLKDGPAVPIHLNQTYYQTCIRQRIPTIANSV
jgi:hypothetical protein